jgi:hypothetical protein
MSATGQRRNASRRWLGLGVLQYAVVAGLHIQGAWPRQLAAGEGEAGNAQLLAGCHGVGLEGRGFALLAVQQCETTT